jgi:hypothetical protein
MSKVELLAGRSRRSAMQLKKIVVHQLEGPSVGSSLNLGVEFHLL